MKVHGAHGRKIYSTYRIGQLKYAMDHLISKDGTYMERFKAAKALIRIEPLTPSTGWVRWRVYGGK